MRWLELGKRKCACYFLFATTSCDDDCGSWQSSCNHCSDSR